MVNQIQQKSEAVGKKLEADLADLKSRLKMQEMETRKANAKFVSSIATQEKLKTEVDVERKAWVEEKAALVTRAEQAEKALAEKTAELFGLKCQVSQMMKGLTVLSDSDDGSCDSCTSSSDDQDPPPAPDAYSCAGDRKGKGPTWKW
nr:uncharacterized protein LOC109741911 [Aegilops tauschii subsp. strangulata]